MSIADRIHDELFHGVAGYSLDGETIDRARLACDVMNDMNAGTVAEMVMNDVAAFRLAFLAALDLACSEMADRIAADRARAA